MTKKSDETRLGMITWVDGDWNYVWSKGLGGVELRYQLNQAVQFELGETVRFIQSHGCKAPQIVHNLMKYDNQETLIPVEPFESSTWKTWKLKVCLTFAPYEASAFRNMRLNDDEKSLHAVAYADGFELVASYVKGVKYEVGAVYRAYISRVPPGHEALAERMGTIFMVIGNGAKFEKVTDRTEIRTLLEKCPWKDMIVIPPDEDEETGLEMPEDFPEIRNQYMGASSASSTTNNHYGYEKMNGQQQQDAGTSRQGNNGQQQQERRQQTAKQWNEQEYLEDEPYAVDFVKQLHETMEGEDHIGLIVKCEQDYSVIWSPKFDLVRVQVEHKPDCAPMYPLTKWVYFRCLPEESQLIGGTRCHYTAYDMRLRSAKGLKDTIVLGRDRFGNDSHVAVRLTLTNASPHSGQFFMAEDSFFGRVLCSVKDRQFRDRMDSSSSGSVEAYAVFSELYHHSKWIVFSYLAENGKNWIKVTDLQSPIDTMVEPFFPEHTYVCPVTENLFADFIGVKKFAPPSGWEGVITEGNKLIDVLGVVVCFEDNNQTSVIATKYGFARQPVKWDLGTWARAIIVPEESNNQSARPNIMRHSSSSYKVLKSKKIAPPISTRVVDHDGTDKMLICCKAKVDGTQLTNDYLGVLQDPAGKIDRNVPTAYLVEICLTRDENDSRVRYWKILKNHGEHTNSVNSVALKLSFFAHAEGRTCDEAHTVLLNPEFDLAKYKPPATAITEPMAKHRAQPAETFAEPVRRRECPLSTSGSTTMRSQREEKFEDVGEPRTFNNANVASTSAMREQPARTHFDTSLAYQPKAPKTTPLIERNEINDTTTGAAGPSSSQRTTAVSKVRKDQWFDLRSQLDMYEPVAKEKPKRALGLVVTKEKQFAIIYSRSFGDCIVLPRFWDMDQIQFDELFQLGKFFGVAFARVAEQRARRLIYPFICLPPHKPTSTKLAIRPIMDQFLQINIRCDFTKNNVKQCTEDLDEVEVEQRHYIDTEIGKVYLNPAIIDKNDLLGKVTKLWVTHVQKKYGCFWQIAFNEMKTSQGEQDAYMLEEPVIEVERPPGHPTRLADLLAPSPPPPSSAPLSNRRRAQEAPATQQMAESDELDYSLPPLPARNNIERETGRGGGEGPSENVAALHGISMKLVRSGYSDFLFGSKVPDAIGDDSLYEEVEEESNPDDADREYGTDSSGTEEETPVESSQRISSEDSQRMRIIGGSTPPPRPSHLSPAPPTSQQPAPPAHRQHNPAQQPPPATGAIPRPAECFGSSWGMATSRPLKQAPTTLGQPQTTLGHPRHPPNLGQPPTTLGQQRRQQQQRQNDVPLLIDLSEPAMPSASISGGGSGRTAGGNGGRKRREKEEEEELANLIIF